MSLSVHQHLKAASQERVGKDLHSTHPRFQRKAAPLSQVVKEEERPWEELGSLNLSLFLTLPTPFPDSHTVGAGKRVLGFWNSPAPRWPSQDESLGLPSLITGWRPHMLEPSNPHPFPLEGGGL